MSFSSLRLFLLWKKFRLRVLGMAQEWPGGHDRVIARRFPRTIWMYWGQGQEAAPPLVQACIRSWQRHNPDWKVIVLDDSRLAEFIDGEVPDHVPHQALSDWLRITLLAQHGGVWADATMYCMQPLSNWLPPLMHSGFLAFVNPGPDRVVASWFLASEQGNPLTRSWASAANEYLKTVTKPDVYFWFHYTFQFLTSTHAGCRKIWRNSPRLNAEGPLLAQKSLLRGVAVAPEWDLAAVPMFKLNWRTPIAAKTLEDWVAQSGTEKASAAP